MSEELQTIIDLIRYGASRFNAAGLTFGHSYDNALDEATQLTLHALHLPHDLSPVYGNARVTEAEKEDVLGLFLRAAECIRVFLGAMGACLAILRPTFAKGGF